MTCVSEASCPRCMHACLCARMHTCERAFVFVCMRQCTKANFFNTSPAPFAPFLRLRGEVPQEREELPQERDEVP